MTKKTRKPPSYLSILLRTIGPKQFTATADKLAAAIHRQKKVRRPLSIELTRKDLLAIAASMGVANDVIRIRIGIHNALHANEKRRGRR